MPLAKPQVKGKPMGKITLTLGAIAIFIAVSIVVLTQRGSDADEPITALAAASPTAPQRTPLKPPCEPAAVDCDNSRFEHLGATTTTTTTPVVIEPTTTTTTAPELVDGHPVEEVATALCLYAQESYGSGFDTYISPDGVTYKCDELEDGGLRFQEGTPQTTPPMRP